MMAQSYPLRCFVEYPPAQQPPKQNNAPLACGIPPVVYPPPPMMQSYDVYHSPPPPPPPKKIAKAKKSEKRAIMTTAAVKRKQTSPSSLSLAAIQSRIYKNGKLDPDLVKGLCQRSTGKWQAQLYWGGKNQYVGTFDSQDDAALACAIVQEELGHNGSRIDPKTTVGQLIEAREKAYEALTGLQHSPVAKKAKTVVESKKPVAKATRASTRKKSPPCKPETKRVYARKAEQDKTSRKARKSIQKKESSVDEPRKTKRGVSKKKGASSNDSTMDADVSRGVTIRPSNRWQAQIYFQGKSRYIGVFNSKEAAARAFVVTRGLLKSEPQVRMETKEASDTFIKARDKAFLAVRAESHANDYNW